MEHNPKKPIRYTVYDVKQKMNKHFFNEKALFISEQEFKREQGITNLSLNVYSEPQKILTIAILKIFGNLHDSPEKYGGLISGISLFKTHENNSLSKIIKKEYKTISNLIGRRVTSEDYSRCLTAISYLNLLKKPYTSEVLAPVAVKNSIYMEHLKTILTGVVEIEGDPIFIVQALQTGMPIKDLKFLLNNSAPKKHVFSIGEAAYTPIVIMKPNQTII